jgi:hypothetical protein
VSVVKKRLASVPTVGVMGLRLRSHPDFCVIVPFCSDYYVKSDLVWPFSKCEF